MATKAELQDQATALGLEFTTATTKPELEELIAGATAVPEQYTSPHERCPHPDCGRVRDHIHA